MKPYLLFFMLVLQLPVCFAETLNAEYLAQLAGKYELSERVLADYIESYNYKCPEEITAQQVLNVINDPLNDTELSVMQESENMNWRDIYVEARSAITCQTDGEVQKGY